MRVCLVAASRECDRSANLSEQSLQTMPLNPACPAPKHRQCSSPLVLELPPPLSLATQPEPALRNSDRIVYVANRCFWSISLLRQYCVCSPFCTPRSVLFLSSAHDTADTGYSSVAEPKSLVVGTPELHKRVSDCPDKLQLPIVSLGRLPPHPASHTHTRHPMKLA